MTPTETPQATSLSGAPRPRFGLNIPTAYLLIAIVVLSAAAAVLVLTALGRLTALGGYSGAASLALGGTALVVAWRKNFRGHWSFVTAVALLTLGLAAVGGEIDEYRSHGRVASDLAFGLSLSAIFLALGALTLWSSHKLHLRTIQAESPGTLSPNEQDGTGLA